MAQVFKPAANTIAKLAVFGGAFFLALAVWSLNEFNRSQYMTRTKVAREQPVPFSHKHHNAELGIDCRYCHTSVETSAFAGIPPTQTCMNCHSQIWKDSPMLEPVRASFASNRSLEWVRVHDLPDFVYFNHSIHIHKGIGCVSCHGRVDQMNLTWQQSPLQMEWCLNCHRNPAAAVRPREEVFNMAWKAENQEELGARLVKAYNIESRDDCSVCHR